MTGLPADSVRRALVMKTPQEIADRLWRPECWVTHRSDDTRLANKRQEIERKEALRLSKVRAKAGQEGGKRSAIAKQLLEPCLSKHQARAYESECVSESGFGSSKKNLPLNGKTSQRWEDFLDLYPLKVELDDAAHQFISVVSVDNEGAVFSCLDRYLASDQVLRGAVMKPANWLLTGHWDKWLSDWPKPQQKKHPKGLGGQ